MAKLTIIVLFLCLFATLKANLPKSTKIQNRYALIADKGFVSSFAHQCFVDKEKLKLQPNLQELIELVERLENEVANKTELAVFNSPDKIARMLLQRFNMDSVDLETVEQNPIADSIARIDTEIIGLITDLKGVPYEFPDYLFSTTELCTLLFMFSHSFLHRNPIEELGVVSFDGDDAEAIAPAKLFAGIIASMAGRVELSGKTIASKLSGSTMVDDIRLSDAVLAVTLASQMGSASFYEFTNVVNSKYDNKLIYNVKGNWINDSYIVTGATNFQALTFSHRASMAEIRGALDGYIIGKSLRNLHIKLTLSSILSLYYSQPQVGTVMGKLGVSYCQRGEHLPGKTELMQIGETYNKIYNFVTEKENSVYKGDFLLDALTEASKTQPKFCNWKPSPKKTFKVRCTVEEL